MKKYLLLIGVIALVIGNALVFLQGLSLANQINEYESKVASLREENIDLEKKVYEKSSLSYVSAVAKVMNYTEKAEPVYIDNLLYALNN